MLHRVMQTKTLQQLILLTLFRERLNIIVKHTWVSSVPPIELISHPLKSTFTL